MIEKMTKYSIFLPGSEIEPFIRRMKEMGLMDITRATKPFDEHSESQLAAIMKMKSTLASIEKINWEKDDDFVSIKSASEELPPFDGDFNTSLTELTARCASLESAYSHASRKEKELAPWGNFNPESISELEKRGVKIHFYSVESKLFKSEWEENYPLQMIDYNDHTTHFVTVCTPIDALSEVEKPDFDIREARDRSIRIHSELIECKAQLLRLKIDKALLEKRIASESDSFNTYIANCAGEKIVEGHITMMTGFAPSRDKKTVISSLEESGVFYISEEATSEDNPPVKLRNGRFARNFETLTGMYGVPVYGEFDPTPILAPFFLLFWAFCMGDAGYGLLLIGVGILLKKVDILGLGNHRKLVMTLGVGATIIGFFLATFFGINLSEVNWIPESLKNLMISGKISAGGSEYDISMVAAIAIGVFHICLAMVVKGLCYTKRFGFANALSTWCWILVIIGGIALAGTSLTSVINSETTKWIMICVGITAGLGIYLFNTPGRNPLKNIVPGLWDTYNMVTGILGDVLSYIRLYALGLAGGMLGDAFNKLAGMTLGDNPTWQWLPFIVIALIGHALNFAMSCLGAFVHPLRLTFVEYFKNSGYEGKGTEYRPLESEGNKNINK